MNSLHAQSQCDTLRTQTPGGWGAPPTGNNPGAYLHNNFTAAFPNGLHVGCNDSLVLTSAQAVTDFLPSGGSPSALPSGTLTNPGSAYDNTLASHVVTLELSITFDNYDPSFGPSSINLENLIVTQGSFAGWTVAQVFAEANSALGGCGSSYSLSQLTNALTSINENYVDGQLTGTYLSCPIQLSTSVTDVLCYGNASGAIDLTVNGGVPPYSYSWSNGDTTQDATNVTAGVYSVTVTDNAGSSKTIQDTIDQPSQITTQISTTDVLCYGDCNGDADLTVNGGVPPYSYSWSNGATTQNLTGLCAGTYAVTITDNNGCTKELTNIAIDEPPQLQASTSISSNYNGADISCFGASDGAAEVSASGGIGSYSFNWSDGQTSQIATGLSAGTYGVTVTDANGCEASDSVTLTQPDPVTASVAPTSNYNGYNISCYGGSDGSAEVTPSGGTQPYSFQWDTNANNQTTAEATNLSAGTYSVTVTDANGCTETGSVTLTEPNQLEVDANENKLVYSGYPDSACADLMVQNSSGGVPPYSYSWSNGATSDSINVCSDTTTTYTVTITDQNGCTATDEVKVCAIDVLANCNQGGSKKVKICHNNNTGNGTTNLCVNISAVPFHLSQHGDLLGACNLNRSCNDTVIEESFNQQQSSSHKKGETNDLSAYPNPFSNTSNVTFSLANDEVVTLELYDLTGSKITELFSGQVEADKKYSAPVNARQLSPGVYFCKLKLSDGSTKIQKLVKTPH